MTSLHLTSIKTHFAHIKDPRQFGKITYPLINILFMTLSAVLCGADDWSAITAFSESQQAWLKKYIDLSRGIPSHDTFGDVFARIKREEFQQGFLNWVNHVCDLVDGVVAIDGKKLRRSHDKGVGKEAIHMVSAWGVANGLILGQQKVDAKSNEITAIPYLLEALDLAGCIVTIDAMGCQKEIAAQVISNEADYVLSLKGNQGQLHEDTQEMFDYFQKTSFKEVAYDYHKTVNSGHGRLEIRECYVFNPKPWGQYFRTLHQWSGLSTLVMVIAKRQEGDKTSLETRYYISSLEPKAKEILEATRSHWHVENKLHWVLDVAFKEDLNRTRVGHAPENLAVIRHIALNLLSSEKTAKMGKKNKRLRCAWDIKYREKVLGGLLNLT